VNRDQICLLESTEIRSVYGDTNSRGETLLRGNRMRTSEIFIKEQNISSLFPGSKVGSSHQGGSEFRTGLARSVAEICDLSVSSCSTVCSIGRGMIL
jgi:hypothetical protein